MLFQKNIEPRCTYCQRGTPLDEEKILCTKQGVVAPGGSCRSFKYDPLKRVPPPPVHRLQQAEGRGFHPLNKSRPRLHTRRGRLSALFAFVHGRRR